MVHGETHKMKDEHETKERLVADPNRRFGANPAELAEMRQRIAELEASETERKRAEEALRQEKDFVRRLTETAQVIVLVLDTEGRIVSLNPYMEEISDYRLEEVRGKDWFATFLPERDRDRMRESFSTAIDDTHTRGNVSPIVTKDGREREIEWYDNTLKDAKGNTTGLLAIGNDITERKRIDEALRESEERFRNLFENAPLCILELDLTQTPPIIVRTNRQAQRVYGWPSEESASIPLDMIFPPIAIPEVARVVDALRAGETITLESVNLRRDGSVFPVRISAASATASVLSRIVVTVEDITAEKSRRSEEEAIAEERRRIAREIHDGLAQDLASLRFRIRLWHDLVDRDPAQMHAELGELRELLSKQIRGARRSIFALRPVALDELGFYPALRQFISDFGEQNQLHADLCIPGPEARLPPLLEPVLFRIVQEALNNVGKHAQASMVRIELALGPAGSVTLSVRDDGVGFDLESLDQAARYGHLGLKQMCERVEGLQGTFMLQSQAGRGTEIQVILPLSRP
jgi:PAS domain S-box-containing protein